MLNYDKVKNGIEINTPIGIYNDNLKRQELKNKRTLELMERYVNELVKLGVTKEIAQAISNRMYRNMVKKVKIVRVVKQYIKKEKQRVHVSIAEFNFTILG